MLQSLLGYWCLVLLSSTMLCLAFDLPSNFSPSQSHSHSQRETELRHIVESLETEMEQHTSSIVKRATDRNFACFYRRLSRNSRRFKTQREFMDKMFNIFDMNSDHVIERDEFRAILQLMGIVSSDRF